MTATEPVLVVDPEQVARRLGLQLPLGAADSWTVIQAVIDAQADVEAYLGQPLTPTEYTEAGLWPNTDGTWPVCQAPLVAIVSTTADLDLNNAPTGTYTVVYTAGLDAANDRALLPIRRYVEAAAMNSPTVADLWRAVRSDGGRRVRSLSTEGQSVSYADSTPLGGVGTAVPALSSLDRWKRRSVFQRRTSAPYGLWP